MINLASAARMTALLNYEMRLAADLCTGAGSTDLNNSSTLLTSTSPDQLVAAV